MAAVVDAVEDAVHCSRNQVYVNLHETALKSVYLTFVSSILSILGSIVIIVTFSLWRDVRQSTARVILLFLAIADLGTGLGYLIAVSGYEAFRNELEHHNYTKYDYFCRAQSFFTTFFPVSSFFWTSCMGLYFLIALVFRRPHWGPKLLIISNFVIWGGPFIFLVVMVSLGVLGPTRTGVSTAAAWCFVSDNSPYTNTSMKYLIFELVCGKLWEMLSYFVVVGCYGIILISYRCRVKSNVMRRNGDYDVSRAMHNADLKLMLIPVVFILLRMWGTVRYLGSLAPKCDLHGNEACLSKGCFYSLFSFTYYLQALCDPAQGFGNAILFVFFCKTIRTRLVRLCYVAAYKIRYFCRGGEATDTSHETTPLLSRKFNTSVTCSPTSSKHSPIAIHYSESSDGEITDQSVAPKLKGSF